MAEAYSLPPHRSNHGADCPAPTARVSSGHTQARATIYYEERTPDAHCTLRSRGQHQLRPGGGDSIQPVEGDLFGDLRPSGAPVSLSSVKLLAPVKPNITLAVLLNYP